MIKLKVKENYLNERLEEIKYNLFCTDSATDIVNLLLNKPKQYRVIYDCDFDCYSICDAKDYVHDKMAEEMFNSGYVQQFMNDRDIQKVKSCKYVPVGTDGQRYKRCGNLIYFIFCPNSNNNGENTLDSYYNNYLPITSGNIYIRNEDDLSPNGRLSDIFNKLNRTGNILD